MTALADSPAYAALLTRFPPRIIRSDEQNRSCIETLYELEQHRDSWKPEEAELADLLTLLIEDFEEKHYRLPKTSPVTVLRFLMDQHGLKQKDLTALFGAASTVSEVLSGKRDLNKEQIRRLSERFGVSPEVFF